MLKNLHIQQPSAAEDTISIHQGNCIRQRFKRSDCNRCVAACSSGALSWNQGELEWDQDRCQHCLLCIAECPTGALGSNNLSYVDLLKKLEKVERPVLDCNEQLNTQGHARVPCLGIFANHELRLAFSLALNKPLTLNMTRCKQCHNGHIVEQIKKSISANPTNNQVKLALKPRQLDFEERQCNRREFFSLMRTATKSKDNHIADNIQLSELPTHFTTKRLPASRELLLQAAMYRADSDKNIPPQFWTTPTFNQTCDACNRCVAMCPTGALSKAAESDRVPEVHPEKCVACGLCEEFCPHDAIELISKN